MDEQHLPFEAVQQVGPGPALVLAPHPDDEVLGCAGAMMRHLAAGDDVRVVVVTDGGHGAAPEERDEYVAQREAESRRAAERLGYAEPLFLRLADRGAHFGEELVQRLADLLGELNPTLVYAPSPEEMHPDHRAVALACAEAVRRSPQHRCLAFYEVSQPLSPNLLLDISDLCEAKRAAISCFGSQLAHQAYDEQVLALNRFRTYTLPKQVTAAEAYRVVSTEALRDWLRRWGTPDIGCCPTASRRPDALVSVIVRTVGRSTLTQALSSVMCQTHDPIEVVLVDALGDGGPRLDRMRFPVRRQSEHCPLGRAEAANVGLQAAQGQYLMLLDDDDWLYPDHVAALVSRLEDERLGHAVYSGVECVRVVGERSEVERIFNEPFDPVRLLYENYIPSHAMLFARSLVDDGLRFDTSLQLFEDWDFWLQVATRTRVRHHSSISAAYRAPGASRLYEPGSIDADRAYDAILEKWHRLWTPEQLKALMRALREHRVYPLEELRMQLVNAEMQCRSFGEQLAEADRRFEDERAHCQQLREQLQERNERSLAFGEQLAEADRRFEDERALCRQLREQLQATNERAQQREELRAETARQLQKTNERAQQREGLLAQMGEQLQKENERAQEHERLLAQVQAEAAQLRSLLHRQQAEADAQQARLAAAKAELDAERHHVAALLSSRSWRWTKPARVALRRILEE